MPHILPEGDCLCQYIDTWTDPDTCISTAGARSNPAWLSHLLSQGYSLYCGFDADPTGDHMAEAMIALHPAIQRLRPPLHDWNDTLIASA